MTEVIVVLQQQSPSHFSSTSSSSSTQNDDQISNAHINNNEIAEEEEENINFERTRKVRERYNGDQVSVVELLLTAFRRSLIGPCSATTTHHQRRDHHFSSLSSSPRRKAMEIGWPSNVRHVTHVTFDRFNGFLGLPVEFEPHVPLRPPSASANVFGVSTESMQLSFDSRGNSVPTILLMMQKQLYAQGGLQVEGIFRINAENSREEYVRDQLNNGIIPDDIDVHCLASLIKAWFRELPTGLLDTISPEQVIQSQSEEECARLVSHLPPAQSALLDWAINLMADVAQMENLNKMNARNVAMVFAPNMTQMADPLTALMYAVQVMNFLQTLVMKTLKERADSVVETSPETPHVGPPDEDGYQTSSQLCNKEAQKEEIDNKNQNPHLVESDLSSSTIIGDLTPNVLLSSIENTITLNKNDNCSCEALPQDSFKPKKATPPKCNKNGQSSTSPRPKKGSKKPGILGRINSRKELIEAWR